MSESTFERYEEPAEVATSGFARVRGVVSTAIGAIVALSLLLALGVWFYRLGVRDAQNVPIIRASTDPAKVRPEDPGGSTAPHQGVKSYEIAESGQTSAVAALVAPEPAKPAREDVAMADLQTPEPKPQTEVDQLIEQAIGESAQETAALSTQPTVPQPSSALPTEPAVTPVAEAASALPAETGDQLAALETADTQPQTLQPVQPATPSDDVAAQPEVSEQPEVAEKPDVVGGTDFAPAASPVAPARPANLRARVQTAAVEAQQDQTNLASAAANSSVQIQLAADPSEDAIRNRWRRVFNANKDLLRDKALAVQTTQSGGTTFYRLRVGPFKDRSEAIAVCQALKARGQDCLVARNG